MPASGVSAPRGSAPGRCLLPGGCLLWGVSAPWDPGGGLPGTATAAGGTHPTGMHSCCILIFNRDGMVFASGCVLDLVLSKITQKTIDDPQFMIQSVI